MVSWTMKREIQMFTVAFMVNESHSKHLNFPLHGSWDQSPPCGAALRRPNRADCIILLLKPKQNLRWPKKGLPFFQAHMDYLRGWDQILQSQTSPKSPLQKNRWWQPTEYWNSSLSCNGGAQRRKRSNFEIQLAAATLSEFVSCNCYL